TDADVPQATMLFFYARRLLESLGDEQPTVVVFEDVHWAQPSEVELLQYLAKHLRDSPLLLVATARPELLDRHASWSSGLTAHTTVALDPLRADEAELLAGALVHRGDAELRRLVETAGGNPLFLEELASSLLERGEGQDLPVTVREAIAARVDALPAHARATLLSAAVVGRTFWRGVVAAVADVADLDDALSVLETKDFIRRDRASQLAGDAQFTFRHMLIRDVAYGTVPRSVRRQSHAAVATFVEESLSEATESLSTILAHHWREAGEPARAIPYLVAAAEAARRGWAQDAAIGLYTLAIDVAEEDDVRRRLKLQRAIALVVLWEMERAAEELSALLPELEGDDRLEALIALGHAYVWTEQDSQALAIAAEAAAIRDRVEDATTLAAITAMEAQALAMRGDEGDL